MNSGKQWTIIIIFVLFLAMLIAKAAQLQLIDESYKSQANRTTLLKKTWYPSRGLIYDRNGTLLVQNNTLYNIMVTYNELDKALDTAKLCSLLEIDKATFDKNINKNFRSARYSKIKPFVFLSQVNVSVASRFMEHLHEFDGFDVEIRETRSYPHTNAAHMLGFMGEANKEDIATDKYQLGDYLGKTGLEKQCDSLLRGTKGHHYIMKDNVGRELGSFQDGKKDIPAVSGMDIITTIDLELQAYAEQLMQNKRGSIVAIEPSTGEIIAMVSSPGYDPNVLNLGQQRGKAFSTMLSDSINKPFLDRSLNAKYPPGSIFKPIISLIAMQEGVWNSGKYMSCPGFYQYRTFKYGCHHHVSPLSLKTAIQTSCNSYFFQMLRDLVEKEGYDSPEIGLSILNKHLSDFGLGKPTGIDLPGEQSGFYPTPKFYNKLYNNKYSTWKSTYIMSIGIGQGEMEFTTLQIANLAVILANRGYYHTPHIVKGYLQSDNNTSIPNTNVATHNVKIDQQHFEPVIEGMRRAISYGTGQTSIVPGIPICGKTGTAQNPHGKDHSVFYSFAPIENPKIAIAVFVENGGFGAEVAAPINGLLIEKYLKGEISPYKKNVENRMLALDLLNSHK